MKREMLSDFSEKKRQLKRQRKSMNNAYAYACPNTDIFYKELSIDEFDKKTDNLRK